MTIEWFDGVPITVEAGLSSATGSYGVWDSSLWDAATWGPGTVWADISEWVAHIATRRRFSRDLQAWEAGEATVVLRNDDGRFSPDNMDSPYVVAGVSGIRPWRPIRISVFGVPIYTGYSMAWNETYERGHATATVTVPCRDELASLARVDGFETAPVGDGEESGRRIHRILNNAGHMGDRAIDVGRFPVQATTLAQNTVAELKLTADSEGGALWVEADGTVWFSNRFSLLEEARSNTAQATFGDGTTPVTSALIIDGGADAIPPISDIDGGSAGTLSSVYDAAAPVTTAPELPCIDIVTVIDTDRLVNYASFAREGGAAQVVADLDSRALYGDKTYQRHDLINVSDLDVAGLAQLHVAANKDAELRVRSVTFTPRRSDYPALLLNALGRRVRDRVRVNLRPKGGHTITRDSFVSGVSHAISQEGEWLVTFDLESADPWTDFTSSLWDTATWDGAAWFF